MQRLKNLLNKNVNEHKQKSVKLYACAVIAVLLYMLLYIQVFRFSVVPSESMLDTIGKNDIVVSTSIYESVDRYDIVIFKQSGRLLIKRIIGMPGDTLTFKDGDVYANGTKLEDGFTLGNTYSDKSVTIPAGCYFVLGDNRENSSDSRVFGCIKEDVIWGKAVFSLSPKVHNIQYKN